MDLIDFNGYEQNERMYGGTAGRKLGITYEGQPYILKLPGNLRDQHMKNIQLSYSNSPVCEYIGSQIYDILGFPVHETLLGKRNNKVVVACKDFLGDGEKLYEFDKIKVTFEPRFLDSSGHETNGTGLDLYEVLMTIREHPFLKGISGIEERFWDMFVVDAFIGNPDRNNSNWGIIVSPSGEKRIAPVYDNGNSLNCKWDDEKMQYVLENKETLRAEGYRARRCVYEIDGNRINPYMMIAKMDYAGCSEALIRIVPSIINKLPKINAMIEDIPVLSETQKAFYKKILSVRHEKVLLPAYQEAIEKGIPVLGKKESILIRRDR